MTNETYEHNGKELMDGRTTECGQYATTRVNGKWYYHPTGDWLSFNANEDFSIDFATEEEAFEAAREEAADSNTDDFGEDY